MTQPKKYDAVLGGKNSLPTNAAVLGGVEGLLMQLPHCNALDRQIEILEKFVGYGEKAISPLANLVETSKDPNFLFWARFYLGTTVMQCVAKDITYLPEEEMETVKFIYQKLIDKCPLPVSIKKFDADYVKAAIDIAKAAKREIKFSAATHIKHCLNMDYDKAIARFLEFMQKSYKLFAPHYEIKQNLYFRIDSGRKYDRIVSYNTFAAIALGFVVKGKTVKFEQGDILKAKSWKGPALNCKRDNIFEISMINCEALWAGW